MQNIQFRIFVDSGAVLEKQWADFAGIGWQGKMALLFTINWGLFFPCRNHVLDTKIKPASPTKASCGNCNLCVQACPTGTTFGCDICQNVCPFNKHRLAEPAIRYNFDNEIINYSEEIFK